MAQGHRLSIYKRDRRFKLGERFEGAYNYDGYGETAMANELRELEQRLYPAAQGWRLVVRPLTVQVQSLMSGEWVEIDYEDQGTVCDPSMERYWSA